MRSRGDWQPVLARQSVRLEMNYLSEVVFNFHGGFEPIVNCFVEILILLCRWLFVVGWFVTSVACHRYVRRCEEDIRVWVIIYLYEWIILLPCIFEVKHKVKVLVTIDNRFVDVYSTLYSMVLGIPTSTVSSFLMSLTTYFEYTLC